MAKNDIFQEKPSIRINEDELPELKDWEVDKEYTLEVKVKLMNLGRSDYENKPKLWGSFRVLDVKNDTDADDDPGMKGFNSYKGDREKPKRNS